MHLFTQIDDAFAIVSQRGVYKQVPLFRRGDFVYCKQGAGFAQMIGDGATSVPTLRWLELSIADETAKGQFGRLVYKPKQTLRAA